MSTITSTGDIDWTTVTTGTATGAWSLTPPTTVVTYTSPEPELVQLITPKCYQCGKEAESITTYERNGYLIIIIGCHNDERRIDISLKRFKGDRIDATEWFSDTFQWVFAEEEKWRKVKPDTSVSTIHADRKIISEWLDNM